MSTTVGVSGRRRGGPDASDFLDIAGAVGALARWYLAAAPQAPAAVPVALSLSRAVTVGSLHFTV
jgi:hypothetical protein